MTENEDVVMTRLSLSSEIILRYEFHKQITPVSKYCLPFFLKSILSIEDIALIHRAESRTMLNSVVMLSTDGENDDDKIPVVPIPINSITVDQPQTIFLTMRMFPKGQQFNTLSRLYLDSIVNQDLLYQHFNINPTAIDNSNIISYLSSMFLLLQNNSNFDQDIEVIFGSQELESFIRRTSLDTSKRWGSIHSRRLARVLFTICLFLAPIMPFDILSKECAKIFEPIKKEKLNALFYFIFKRDIWFALQSVTNGSLAETFSLACACADISPIILLQICSYMAPIREGRYLDRTSPSSSTPGECPNVPAIQASTKTWVNLISLRFNNLLPPKPNNVSFDVDINVFYQLGLNNLKEQPTDLKSAMHMFLLLKQAPIFNGDVAPSLYTPFRFFKDFPLPTNGFALDYENHVYRQFAMLRTLQLNPILSSSVLASPQLVTNEASRSLPENTPNINFHNFNHSLQPSSSTSSPINNIFGHSPFPREEISFNGLNFNNLNTSLFHNTPSTSSSFLNNPTLFSQSPLIYENSVTQRSNGFGSTFASGTDTKKASKSHDQKLKLLKSLKTSSKSNSGSSLNSYGFSSSSIHQSKPSSLAMPLEGFISQSAQRNNFTNKNHFNNFQPSNLFSCEPSPSSSASPLGINLLENAQPPLFNRSNNNFQLNNILNVNPSTSFSPRNINTSLLPIPDDFSNKSNDNITPKNFQPRNILNSKPSTSISPPKKNSSIFLSTEAAKNSSDAFELDSTLSISISPPEKDDMSWKAGSSRDSANKSTENLSPNCNNFQLNQLIDINSATPNPTVINCQIEKMLPVKPDACITSNCIASPSIKLSDIDNMSTNVAPATFTSENERFEETIVLKNECDLKENKKAITESVNKLKIEPILPKAVAESVTSAEIKSENEIEKKAILERTIVKIDDENEKAEEEISEESDDAQEFELLIETSFEPLVEDSTSELIVAEENIECEDEEEEEEMVDPDNCPVRCICGFNHLEQQTIFCEKCRVWKHIKCLKAEKYANSDLEYFCPDCKGKTLPLSPSEAQDLVAKSMKLEHLDFKTKECNELKLSGALNLEWKSLLENSNNCTSSEVGKLIFEKRMRWAVIKRGQAGRLLAGFGIKAGKPVIGVNGIAAYMMDAKNYCTCYRNLSLSFLPEPIIIEMKGRNGGLAHEILPSCRPNCEIKFSIYKNNLYCYLAALCEIDNDDELTIAFPDSDNLHVSCAESSSDCTESCPSQKFSRLTKNKKAVSGNEPPSKKRKRL